MISSLIPVLRARVVLCSTWLAGANRFSKNSTSVGRVDIGASAGMTRLPSGPRGPKRLPAPRRIVASGGAATTCASPPTRPPAAASSSRRSIM